MGGRSLAKFRYCEGVCLTGGAKKLPTSTENSREKKHMNGESPEIELSFFMHIDRTENKKEVLKIVAVKKAFFDRANY